MPRDAILDAVGRNSRWLHTTLSSSIAIADGWIAVLMFIYGRAKKIKTSRQSRQFSCLDSLVNRIPT
jgi:hypothetical protein